MRAYMCPRVTRMNTWQKYVRLITDEATQTAIGERTGIAQSTISRWLNATKVPTEAAQVAKFAQAYKRNPLEAFVAAGMLNQKEAGLGLKLAERKLLDSLSAVTNIRDSQVSKASELERDLRTGTKAARRKGKPPSGN